MNVSFCYSHLNEYKKLIYCLYNTETGFYKDAGMHLSYGYSILPNTVIIPKLKDLYPFYADLQPEGLQQQLRGSYTRANSDLASGITKKSFWSKYTKIKKEIAKNYPIYTGREFSTLYKSILKLSPLSIKQAEENWNEVAGEFGSILNTLFVNNLQNVNVYLTYFGTVSSYNHKGRNLNIYLRKDADISQIAFCILSYYIHKYPSKLTWQEQQRAVDFLLLNTKLNNLFPKFHSVIDSSKNPECDISLILNSEKLYKELGINLKSSIEYKNNKVYIMGEQVTNLTKQEQLVLHEMFINKNQVTTFEQISNVLWGDDFSAFSLQAISKTIERIRSKITNAGLNRQVIFTRRKEGYLLND